MTAASVSSMSGAVDQLFWFLTGLCGLTAVLIIGLLAGFSIVYRRRPGRTRAEPVVQKKVITEAILIGVPLVVFLGIFVWGARIYFRQMQIPEGSLPVYAVAQQWMWKFQHLEGRREINELHVPEGRPVALTLISQDVIHSFFIPAFRIKMDVLPGRYTQAWFKANRPGKYRLFCSQYCGTWHARMTGTVIVMKPKAYEEWLAQDLPQAMAVQGKKILEERGCLQCHAQGSRVPSPALEGLFGRQVRLTDGTTVTADEAYIRDSIFDPGRQITAGYANVMPTYKGQLNEEDVTRLIEYLKAISLWKTGQGKTI